MGNDGFWFWIAVVLGLIVISIIGVSQVTYNQRCKMFIDAGYEEGTVLGNGQVCWVKSKGK